MQPSGNVSPQKESFLLGLNKYGFHVFQYKVISVIISMISVYTLSDLGDLSNLIVSLSRTIQQYSPPSEWIM